MGHLLEGAVVGPHHGDRGMTGFVVRPSNEHALIDLAELLRWSSRLSNVKPRSPRRSRSRARRRNSSSSGRRPDGRATTIRLIRFPLLAFAVLEIAP